MIRDPQKLAKMVFLALLAAPARGGGSYPEHAVPRLEGITIPGLPAVTGRIQVDQFGYLPDSAKVAVISDPQRGYNAADSYQPGAELELRRKEDGAIGFKGAPTQWNGGAVDALSGDRGWWFDFSSFQTPGNYYVYDPSTKLRSPVFKIADNVYQPVLKAAMRTYYYQREGMALQAPYAESPWILDAEYTQDKEARAVWAKGDPSTARDVSGGWMDAGDTDKYPPFNADVIHPLLYAYKANPRVFGDDFNIPESGNGLPDILDEVKYQLDWLVKMEDVDGGVYIKMGNVDYGGGWPQSKDTRPRYYGPKCSASTLWTCGILAHAARVYSGFKPWEAYGAELKRRALLAWDWYTKNPRSYNCDTGEIKSGIANRSAEDQDRMEAIVAIHLWALTGEKRFQSVIQDRAALTRQLSEYFWSPYEAGSGESLIEYAGMPGADPDVAAKVRDQLSKSGASADWAPPPEADLYRAALKESTYHWGSLSPRAGVGFTALQASQVPGTSPAQQARLKERALGILHSFHGVNPLSMVYLSNMGRYGAALSASHIYHGRYGSSSPWSGNPPPGYVPGGPNKDFGGKSKDAGAGEVEWIKDQPPGKAYANFDEGWPQSSWEITEIAIYYQAAYIRLLAEFVRP